LRVASEHIVLPADSSWGFLHQQHEEYPFKWHCHREYELTLTLNARGRRYVDDDIGTFDELDLVLLGPNLPHSWSMERRVDTGRPISTYVLWFTPEWVSRLAEGFVEYADPPSRARFPLMLEILDLLCAGEPQRLASATYGGRLAPTRKQRKLEQVLGFIHEHYTRPVTAEETARRFGMSQSTFFRFFRRHMKQSFSDYLTALRIGRACSLLLESDEHVYVIAEKAGYANVSHFYRQFRQEKRMSPADFRRRFEPTGEDPSATRLRTPSFATSLTDRTH